MTQPDIVHDIRAVLEAEQRRLAEEIRHYPPPIPRCDAQFNALIEQRANVAQALYDLSGLSRDDNHAPGGWSAFAESARAIEGDAGRQIASLLAST